MLYAAHGVMNSMALIVQSLSLSLEAAINMYTVLQSTKLS